MATVNDSATQGDKCKEQEVQSPTKVPRQTPTEQSGVSTHAFRTEKPSGYSVHREETPVGNPKLLFALKMENRLGIFYDRANTTWIPSEVRVITANIRIAVTSVLTEVLTDLLRSNREKKIATPDVNITDIVPQLANGVMIALYTKLRLVNRFDKRFADLYRRVPKVPEPFKIPQPYVLAIEQLGRFKASGMPKEAYFTPNISVECVNFGCTDDAHPWSPDDYSRSVFNASKIGLQFTTADLTVKRGSSWWLYRPIEANDSIRLECPIPEENFTDSSAIIACLFCADADGDPYNPIIHAPDLGDAVYGSMARNLPVKFAVNCYNAIGPEDEFDYPVVNQ